MKYALTDLTYEEMLRCHDLLNSKSAFNTPTPVVAETVTPAAPTTDTAPAPITPTPAATAPLTDANGLPWDKRIHASSKAVNKDGTWRYKRGVEKDLIAEVEAEIGGGVITDTDHITEENTEQSDPAETFGQPAAVEQPVAPVQPVQAVQVEATAPVNDPLAIPPHLDRNINPVVQPTVEQPAAAPAQEATYADFFAVMSDAVKNQHMGPGDIQTMCTTLGVGNVNELQGDTNLIAMAIELVKATVASKTAA